MSVSDEEPYSTIFASLKHPIRRTILRMLSKKPMSFSEMLGVLGVSSSFLTYHLENLGELVGKVDDGKYRLSTFGEAAIAAMTKVEDIPTTAFQQSPERPETRSQKWSRPLGIIAKRFKTSETEPRKVVRRSVALALAMMCIILVASIGGAIIYYTSVVSDKDKTISSQNSQVSSLRNQNNQLQTWLEGNLTLINQTQMWLGGNVTAYNRLQNEVSSIHIWGTKNSTIWVNNETVYVNQQTVWVNNETVLGNQLAGWSFSYVPSAGYVSVLFSSNSTSTTVVLDYYSNGTMNTLPIHVGSSGMIVYHVLPSTVLAIVLGNSLGEPSTFIVTITYYY